MSTYNKDIIIIIIKLYTQKKPHTKKITNNIKNKKNKNKFISEQKKK